MNIQKTNKKFKKAGVTELIRIIGKYSGTIDFAENQINKDAHLIKELTKTNEAQGQELKDIGAFVKDVEDRLQDLHNDYVNNHKTGAELVEGIERLLQYIRNKELLPF